MNKMLILGFVLAILFISGCQAPKTGGAITTTQLSSPSASTPPTYKCYKNQDCGAISNSTFCYGNYKCPQITTPVCRNPGTSGAYCTNVTQPLGRGTALCQLCEGGCANGACIEQRGSIHVTMSPVYGDLYIDNEWEGNKPQTVSGFFPGIHTVNFTNPTY